MTDHRPTPDEWIKLARKAASVLRIPQYDFEDAVGDALVQISRRKPATASAVYLTARGAIIEQLRTRFGRREASFKRAARTTLLESDLEYSFADKIAQRDDDFDRLALFQVIERARLTDEELEVIVASMAGISGVELARLHGVTGGTISLRLVRARNKLRRYLDAPEH